MLLIYQSHLLVCTSFLILFVWDYVFDRKAKKVSSHNCMVLCESRFTSAKDKARC